MVYRQRMSEERAPEAVPAERKRRKKRRKQRAEAEAPALRPELDAEGHERPRFLLSFPQDAELQPAIAAFEAGNYAAVRELTPRLLESESEAVRRAAAELRRRIEPDPLMKYLLLAVAVLVAALLFYAYGTHGAHVH